MYNRRTKPIIIGVTGSLGTGKSTVAGIFKRLGAKVLDADKLAHQALEMGTAAYRKVIEEFGRSILETSGRVNRTKLAEAVFVNKISLDKLCKIIHPAVIKKIEKSIKNASRAGNIPAIVIDAPLLIEAGLHNKTDFLIVVKTTSRIQIERAMKKTGLSASEVVRRIKSQMPLSRKLEMADYIIDNEGNKKNLKLTVKKIWEAMKSGRK